MNRALVWFKTDLRLHDNETLIKAMSQYDEIIPVYCFDDNHFKTTNFGLKKTGSFRAQFLIESLIDLDCNLRKVGSGLVVVKGCPEIKLLELVKQYDVKKVFSKAEVAFEEIETQKKVEQALNNTNCNFETVSTNTLYHPDDLPFTLDKIPFIFTDFRKQVEAKSSVRKIFSKPTSINSPVIEAIELPTMEQLGLKSCVVDCRAAFTFIGGETEAQKRLKQYTFESKSISTYKHTRNGMIGVNYSSKFSAALSMGCLSAIDIYNEVKDYELKYGSNESTYWLIFELIWRDYFYFMMKKYPYQYFTKNGIKKPIPNQKSHNKIVFKKWINGHTENDFINANMLELKYTGFMSNRGRQNVASYLCHDLKLDWRYGAAYFEEQLIDYDVSSNWCNWAYIAGVGNNPRNNAVFNVEKQADEYDKNKSYRNLWLNQI
jgi:deoxyribodipyrimidine photo-lyase